MLSQRRDSSKRDGAFRLQRFQCGVRKRRRLDPLVTTPEEAPWVKAVGDHLVWVEPDPGTRHRCAATGADGDQTVSTSLRAKAELGLIIWSLHQVEPDARTADWAEIFMINVLYRSRAGGKEPPNADGVLHHPPGCRD